MLKLKKGVDILAEVGGIETIDQAKTLFRETLDGKHFDRLAKIRTEEALLKIANAIAMCEPDKVFITTGSPADMRAVRKMSLEKGEETALAMKKHTVHFDLPEEQGRIVDRTYYVVNPGEPSGELGKKMPRRKALAYVRTHMKGIMRGKTMFVGFFSRGPVGAKMALPALEISSSTYVMHSADILYRHGYDSFDRQVKKAGFMLTNVHSEGRNRPEDLPDARVLMDRSWLTTFSANCTYAGNTLLLKKGNHRFAVDLSTYYGRGREISEHMFITGMKEKSGRTTWFVGAAPSGCGKTTTAMAGTEFVGDDLAQMWIDGRGTLRAINPEQGIFGIVADVNEEGDPYLMKCLRKPGAEVIWSNVLVDAKGRPHWTGNGERHARKGVNFQGEWFKGKTDKNGKEIPISHPNARCTLRCASIGNYSREMGSDPKGTPVKVVTYSGRDADTMPPVWVARNPAHGVVIGASIVSAATATEVGASGVKRQPWANAPFIPGALADYMKAQFRFFGNRRFSRKGRPILAGLNYFLTDEARGGRSRKLLGEKRDVKAWLTWLARFAHGDYEGLETPIGFIPKYEDLRETFAETIGKTYPRSLYMKQFSIYCDLIQARIDLQREAFGKEKDLPKKLYQVYDQWERGLAALKRKHGAVVTPDLLG